MLLVSELKTLTKYLMDHVYSWTFLAARSGVSRVILSFISKWQLQNVLYEMHSLTSYDLKFSSFIMEHLSLHGNVCYCL